MKAHRDDACSLHFFCAGFFQQKIFKYSNTAVRMDMISSLWYTPLLPHTAITNAQTRLQTHKPTYLRTHTTPPVKTKNLYLGVFAWFNTQYTHTRHAASSRRSHHSDHVPVAKCQNSIFSSNWKNNERLKFLQKPCAHSTKHAPTEKFNQQNGRNQPKTYRKYCPPHTSKQTVLTKHMIASAQ